MGMPPVIRVDCASRTLRAFGQTTDCAIGRGGALPADAKREGDGATPLGQWRILGALLRPDRIAAPRTLLPWRWLRPDDGWSDDPADPAYNRPVRHPHPFSAERLWRDDRAYDIILISNHNHEPAVPGMGSAVFWHIAQPDFRPTEGCVACTREALESLLPHITPGTILDIHQP